MLAWGGTAAVLSSALVKAVVSVVPPSEVLICGAGLGVRSLGSWSGSLHKQKEDVAACGNAQEGLIFCCC